MKRQKIVKIAIILFVFVIALVLIFIFGKQMLYRDADLHSEEVGNSEKVDISEDEESDSKEDLKNLKLKYKVGFVTRELGYDTFKKWFQQTEDGEMILDERYPKAWFVEFAESLDTYYISKEFKTSYSRTITIENSNYGWQIDTEKSAAILIEDLKNAKSVENEVIYSKTANSWGGEIMDIPT